MALDVLRSRNSMGDPVADGPFAFKPGDPNGFRVRLEAPPGVSLRQTNRGLRRTFRSGSPTLPDALDVGAAFNTQSAPLGDPDLATYDFAPWLHDSRGFRSRLEGFTGTGLHNQVHRWIGGDMAPASSPNDPVFFLHHANVDRLWESWMDRHGRNYVPTTWSLIQHTPGGRRGSRRTLRSEWQQGHRRNPCPQCDDRLPW
ncbi:tyrosinase family protein [Streptomyces violaceus]|uniref:tyrosinase family protein n=1 Tax=Streptomyces violaceus TaxID=1936 RepID=UPI00381C5D61